MARKGADPDHGGAPADDGWGTLVPGTRPIAGAQAPGDAGSAHASAQPGRGRTWLILLVSFVVQLVVVLAAGNTTVVDKGIEFRNDHNDTLGAFATLPSVYAWRLTPANGDTINAYPAALFALLALFVVAALLSLALVRGPVTFWRAFVAVWLSVIVGTLAAGMVRRAVIDDFGRFDETGGKVAGVIFQGGGTEVVAGVITGLLAGLIAAVVAVVTRRPAEAVVPFAEPEPAPYVEPAPPPPWHGDDVRPAAAPYAPPPARQFEREPQPAQAQATTQFAATPAEPVAGGEPTGATTRLRREDLGEYGPPTVVRREQPVGDEPVARDEPARDEPARAVPVEDAPVENAPVEDAPVEDAPVEDAPVEDAPVEDATAPRREDPERAESASSGRAEQRTTAFPAAQRPAPEATQAMPAFPRPPDDEDFGHHPDDD